MPGVKHVTSACLSCRRRKVKCDGNDPCSCCSSSKLDCVYNAEADMRRIPARKIISDLRSRVTELENALRAQQPKAVTGTDSAAQSLMSGNSPSNSSSAASGQDDGGVSSGQVQEGSLVSSSDDSEGQGEICSDHGATSMSVTGSLRQDDGETQLTAPLSDSAGEHAQLTATGVNMSGEDLNDNDDNFTHFDQTNDLQQDHGQDQNRAQQRTERRGPLSPLTHSHSAAHQDVQPPHPAHPPPAYDELPSQNPSGSEDNITDILAARMGGLRIAEDGELRYYGPTSNLHVHPNGSYPLSHSNIRYVETEGLNVLKRLSLDQEVSMETEAYLARLYFCWEDPAIHAVDEGTFFAEKQNTLIHGKKSPYYSETLNNAICAIGAKLACGEYLGIPDPAPEFFSQRAKALLDIEMDSPTVATVQALVVMSASEAAFTRDARGWLYSGMAARLSADLGLHLDITQHIQSVALTERDLEIRRITFWGVFIQEHMWSMYVGRPWSIGVKNITVPRPRSASDGTRKWQPYPERAGHVEIPRGGLAFPLEACTDANVSICEFFPRINDALYAEKKSPDVKVMVDFLARTKAELWTWHDSLHEGLRVDSSAPSTPYVPAVLQLHMQFHATLIALCRPYLSGSLIRCGQSLASQQDRDILFGALPDCLTAAHEIAKLLRCYQRQHSLPRANIQIIHIILTACLVFVHDVCVRDPSEARTSQTYLQFCCHALGQLGHAFGNATRALEVIILVRSEWQKLSAARRTPTAGLKRRNTGSRISEHGTLGQDGAHRAKRRSSGSSGMDNLYESGGMPGPPAFSAFQTLYNNFAGYATDISMPEITEDIPGASWDIPMDVSTDLNQLMMPAAWPGPDIMPSTALDQESVPFCVDGQHDT